MAEAPMTADEQKDGASWFVTVLLSVVVLGAAAGVAVLTFFTEPTAEKTGASKETAMLVDVTDAEAGDFRPHISAQGTVEPARDIVLRSRVTGRVVSVASSFTPGGDVDEGDELVRLEAADYRNTLEQRKAELQQVESDLTIQKGRRDAARAEYDRFGKELSDENESLVLRKPQLEAAKQEVEAAKAAVNQAKLDLSRTRIEAPFDGHIVRRDVNVGSQVSPSDPLARLVGTDRYWVGVELPVRQLRWVSFATDDASGSAVQIRDEQSWPENTHREGSLYKRVGTMDDDTRMVRVLAEIPDPLALEASSGDETPALIIGAFVDVTILGDELEDVVRLDRDYIRDGDTVWVMSDGKLEIRDVDIRVQDPNYAYIADGVSGGDDVVTSSLATVAEGAALRVDETDEGGSGE